MRHLKVTVLAIAALLAHCTGTAPLCAAEKPHRPLIDYWMGLYSGPVKIGYRHVTVRKDQLDGREVYSRNDDLVILSKADDEQLRLAFTSRLNADMKLHPVSETMSISTENRPSSAAGKTDNQTQNWFAEARYGEKTIECTTRTGDKTTTRSIAIPPSADLTARCIYEMGARRLSAGSSFSLASFEIGRTWIPPASDAAYFTHATVHVLRRENIKVGARSYDALVVTRGDDSHKTTSWVLGDGQEIRTESPQMYISLKPVGQGSPPDLMEIRETAAEAESFERKGGVNIFVIESDRAIPDSTQVNDLKVRFLGISDKSLAKTDGRQSSTFLPKEKTAAYHIASRSFNPAKSIQLPVKEQEYAKWLAESSGIQVSDEAIQKVAHEITGSETNAYTAATKIRAWVHDNMTYDLAIRELRPTSDILRTKRGVCTDYTILYTALARAAGIPTKMVVGPWYVPWYGDGSFQFHTWAESFVGEWVAFDAVLPTVYVDATHIKMFEGGTETVSDYAKALGRSRAEIMDYSYLEGANPRAHIICVNDGFVVKKAIDGSMSNVSDGGQVAEFTPEIGTIVVTAHDGTTWYAPSESLIDPSPDAMLSKDIQPGRTLISVQGTSILCPRGSTVEIVGKTLDEDPVAWVKVVSTNGSYAVFLDLTRKTIELSDSTSDDSIVLVTPDGRQVIMPPGSEVYPAGKPIIKTIVYPADKLFYKLPDGRIAVLPPGSKVQDSGNSR